GLAMLLVVVAVRGQGPPDGLHALWAALAGLAGLTGLVALYRGLAIGAMGVVAPISGTAPVVAIAVGLARGERPSAVQFAGIGVALAGIVVAGAERHPDARRARVAVGAGLAVVAALAFGGTFVGVDAASNADPYWATLILRLTSCTTVALALAVVRPPFTGIRSAAPALVAVGLLDSGAT